MEWKIWKVIRVRRKGINSSLPTNYTGLVSWIWMCKILCVSTSMSLDITSYKQFLIISKSIFVTNHYLGGIISSYKVEKQIRSLKIAAILPLQQMQHKIAWLALQSTRNIWSFSSKRHKPVKNFKIGATLTMPYYTKPSTIQRGHLFLKVGF